MATIYLRKGLIMKKYQIVLFSAITLMTIAGCTSGKTVESNDSKKETHSALTDKMDEGKEIYANSCTKCHTSSVHTRKDKTVLSLDALEKRVAKCNTKTGAGLDNEELNNLTLFLDKSYYKFSK